jgi:hypothetical protein
MSGLSWHAGESDADYKARVAKPYEEFSQGIEKIRTAMAESETKVATKKNEKARPKHAAKAAAAKTPAAKAKKN